MSTTMEDAIRRSVPERAIAERANTIDTSQLRQRIRRTGATPADLQQARRFQTANVDTRAMERQCVLPAVSDPAALRAFKILRTRVIRRLRQRAANLGFALVDHNTGEVLEGAVS